MEIVSGISLVSIFLDNNNWWRFFIKHQKQLRLAIILNVVKMLSCRSELMGFQQFTCPHCSYSITVPFTCKSKFCSSCGKKATDNWICQNFNTLPKTRWQHITFTMPSELWDFFWVNRHLFSLLPTLAADVIKKLAKQQGILPGIFTAIHTFGRDLKHNVHIHLSVTLGGLVNSNTKWSGKLYFYHLAVKKMWRYAIINMLREQYQAGNLKLPPNLKHIKTYTAFNSWLNFLYSKKWVAHLQNPSRNHKRNIEYLGRYLKRPPIGETRIKKYDSENVTFEYLDHYDDTKKYVTLPVMEFIGKVVSHIHDANFRCIRYFGFLANRVRGKLLPLVHSLLQTTANFARKFFLSWRDLTAQSFGYDPLMCPNCQCTLRLSNITFQQKINFITKHKQIACS